jgi:hypothetical protein
LRELYAPDAYRVDGLWRKKRQGRLFPLFDWMFPVAQASWADSRGFHGVSFPSEFREKNARINLYHLKMIDETRRRHRRDLYAALDPAGEYQAEGYDYLADEAGAVFKKISPRRSYSPPHSEDGGLWMPAQFPEISPT